MRPPLLNFPDTNPGLLVLDHDLFFTIFNFAWENVLSGADGTFLKILTLDSKISLLQRRREHC